ncbi:MAG: Mur ligase family protein [Chloroflexi bacterium]|nr:Mur ligase family protein [Chloroflexota bacterium]
MAAVLNVTPNHLDRHKSMTAYADAKANILRFNKRRTSPCWPPMIPAPGRWKARCRDGCAPLACAA